MEALGARFAAFDHSPSEEHWEGLAEIACELEAMALGEARREFTYSALPTGMGKTSVIVEFTRALVNDARFAEVGVIIFVHQFAQIDALIRDLKLYPHQFAVHVGKDRPDYNSKGRCSDEPPRAWPKARRQAQVLFVTQQKLTRLPRYVRSIQKLFPYHVSPDAELMPRRVRIWDEAIMPAIPLTVSVSDGLKFSGTLFSRGHKEAADTLRSWLQSEVHGNSGVVTVPLLFPEMSAASSFEDDQEIWSEDTPGSQLLALGGLDVRVHSDAYLGESVISYRDILPDDIAPLLILDASGSLRLVYKLWQEGRGRMRELWSPGKTYRNLTINHWERAAGKAAYRDSQSQTDLAEGVLRALQEVPAGERMLVLTHKEGITDGAEIKPYANLEKNIRAKARAWGGQSAEDRLSFITWGKHMASNEFGDIRHVAVVGLLQYPQAVNNAYYRAAMGASAQTKVTIEEINKLRLGEIAHHLFQGVGRGATRRTVEGDVPPGCALWVIFSTYKNAMWVPLETLHKVFPGATVKRWEPLGVELTGGNLKSKNRPRLLAKLVDRIGGLESVSFQVRDLVDEGLGYQTASNLMKDPAIRQAISERGLVLSEAKEKVQRAGSWTIATVYTLKRDVEGVGFAKAA